MYVCVCTVSSPAMGMVFEKVVEPLRCRDLLNNVSCCGCGLEGLQPHLNSHFLIDCWLWTSDKPASHSSLHGRRSVRYLAGARPSSFMLHLVLSSIRDITNSHSSEPLLVLRLVHTLSGPWPLTGMGHSPWCLEPAPAPCQGWFPRPMLGPLFPGPSVSV